MKVIQATALRRKLFETLKRLAYEKEPLLIERRGKPIAALVPPESIRPEPNRPEPQRAGASIRPGRPSLDPKVIADFCARHHLRTLYLFGSILTDHFDDQSDVDLMFEPEGPAPGFFEQMQMADELEAIFGRPIDLVSRRAVEASTNVIRRNAILQGSRIIHGR